ncbi:MAG: response regulator [Chloroflexota bacterium]
MHDAAPSERKPRVLIVDDDYPNLILMIRILSVEGFETDMASYGPTALVKLRENPYDILITDMQMPEMHGDELVRAIRKQGMTLPIIVCAGGSMKISGEMAVFETDFHTTLERTLFDGYISKPISVERFAEQVRSVLNRPNSHPAQSPAS